jgi:hypothetical protein
MFESILLRKESKMPKQKVNNNESMELFGNPFDSFSPEEDPALMLEIFSAMNSAKNQQITAAVELTKLIIEKSPAKEMKEQEILSAFKKASKTITQIYPLTEIS